MIFWKKKEIVVLPASEHVNVQLSKNEWKKIDPLDAPTTSNTVNIEFRIYPDIKSIDLYLLIGKEIVFWNVGNKISFEYKFENEILFRLLPRAFSGYYLEEREQQLCYALPPISLPYEEFKTLATNIKYHQIYFERYHDSIEGNYYGLLLFPEREYIKNR